MSQDLYLVTGAAGHLGNALCHALREGGFRIRALLLPQESDQALRDLDIDIVRGDVTAPESLDLFFAHEPDERVFLFHLAGIVSIRSQHDERVWKTNVGGTENMIELAKQHKVRRMLYVSSVHALPEGQKGTPITESQNYDWKALSGAYAQSKAAASQAVVEASENGLDTVLALPSGIIGPGDYAMGHTTELTLAYLQKRLRVAVNGGYDFADVRDVAAGLIRVMHAGRRGESYILSSRFMTIREYLERVAALSGHSPMKFYAPLWLAKLSAPFAERRAVRAGVKPLYTPYSLHVLESNGLFSHEKATTELGYQARPLDETIQATLDFFYKRGLIQV